jgi:hypothetical protein
MGVITDIVSRDFPEQTIDWLNTKDYYASYCNMTYSSLSSLSDTASTVNPFKADDMSSASTPIRVHRSPDMVYNQTDGTVEAIKAGNYLVIYTATIVVASGTDAGTSIQKINRVNTSGITATMMTSAGVTADDERDPQQCVIHTVIALTAGEKITVTSTTGGSGPTKLMVGTSVLIQRLSGDFATVRYTADSDTITSTSNVSVFDQDPDLGGTVTSNVSGMTYSTSAGRITPSRERMFVNLQSYILLSTTGDFSDARHRSTLNGSLSTNGYMEEVKVGVSDADDPFCSTNNIMKAIPSSLGSQPQFKINSDVPDYKFMEGTCTTVYDISNNGALPSVYFNLILDNGTSSDPGATGMNPWDEDNYSTFTTKDPNDDTNKATNSTIGGNTGITYTPSTGLFVVDEAGDYVIISNVVAKEVSSEGSTFHLIQTLNANTGAQTTQHFSSFFHEADMEPISDCAFTIARLGAGDSIKITLTSLNAKTTAGCSIIIYKVGPRMTKQPGDNEFFDGATRFPDTTQPVGQPIVKTDDTIDSADKGDQRDRRTEQSPFRMAVNGPLTLRGRARSSLPFNVAAGKRGGKK